MEKMNLEDSPDQKADLDDSPDKEFGFDDSPDQKVGLDDSPDNEVGLDDSPDKEVELDDSPHKEVGVDDSPNKEVDLDDSPNKEVGVDEFPDKKVGLDDSPNKEVDLGQYFSKQELDAVSNQQQARLKNIAQNYERMLHLGLPAIKPEFMTEKMTEKFPDSDSDQTGTLDSDRENGGKTGLPADILEIKTENVTDSDNDNAGAQDSDRDSRTTEYLEPPSDVMSSFIDYHTLYVYWKPVKNTAKLDGYKVMISKNGEPWHLSKLTHKMNHNCKLRLSLEGKYRVGVCAFKGKTDSDIMPTEKELILPDKELILPDKELVEEESGSLSSNNYILQTNGSSNDCDEGFAAVKTEVVTETFSDNDNDQSWTSDLENSETDETWTPDQERKKIAKEKTPKKRKLKTDDSKEVEAKCQRKCEDGVIEINESELREGETAKCMHLDVPNNDDVLYCEECNKEHNEDCPVHGPLDYVKDNEVNTKYDPERALHTLPPGLVVKESSIVGAGLGVFTQKEIQPRVMFGPYSGMKTDEIKAANCGYCWQVYGGGKPSHFVDATDKVSSNWMRYINCASSEAEQNLVAFQFRGGIYYRSYKTIYPGTELLCWYGDECGRGLGLVRDKNLLIRPKTINGQDYYPCVFCKTCFTTAVYNVRHLVIKHGGDKLTQRDTEVLDDWLRKNDHEELTNGNQGDNVKEPMRALEQNISENEKEITPSAENYTEELTKGGMVIFKCGFCDYTNKLRKMLKRHMQKHTEAKSYTCDICNYSSRWREGLTRHIRRHVGEKHYKCDVCDYASNWIAELKRHIKRIHTGDECYKCDVCDYTCNSSYNLNTHMRTHSVKKRYKCDFCDYATKSNYHLQSHIRKHTGEKCFQCHVCGNEYKQKAHLTTHMRTHTGERPFKCNICDYASIYSSHLKAHMTKHTGEKSLKCDKCDFACTRNSNLKVHMRKHTGERPYKCKFCDYASKQSGQLQLHMKTHTGEKSLKCEVCDYACNDSSNLRQHMRIHTKEKPYKCEVCDYACAKKNNLQRHIRSHTGERPFKCDVCDYATKQSVHLTFHMKTHTGEKPLKCDVCDYACIQKCNLKKHMKIHRKEKEVL